MQTLLIQQQFGPWGGSFFERRWWSCDSPVSLVVLKTLGSRTFWKHAPRTDTSILMVGCAEIGILENQIYLCLSVQQKYKDVEPSSFIHMSAFRKAWRSSVTLWGFGQPHKAWWWWGYTGSLGQEPPGCVLMCPEISKAFCKLLRGVDVWDKSSLPMHTDLAKSLLRALYFINLWGFIVLSRFL